MKKSDTISIVIRLLRVPHWIKNGFMFAPILFAGLITEMAITAHVVGAFLIFCACSSAVYIFNDVRDKENDRSHPSKTKRPIASGAIGTVPALGIALVLGLVSIGTSLLVNRGFFLVVCIYIGMNILYSLWLKNIVILDVFCIAFGFVLRVVGGGYAAEVENSSWMLICTVLLALFLGFSKRRNEIIVLGGESEEHRKILGEYSIQFLDQMIGVVTACTVISYMLYTVAQETVNKFHTRNLIFTSVFVLYGIFRYLYIIYQKGKGGSPTRIMLTDIPLIINVVLWAITCALIVHGVL
ncbi:decaprenyl-phosphate phosphoribosyltransferase [Planctomycetota bacterium]